MKNLNGFKRILAVNLLGVIAVSSIALPSAFKVFEATYNVQPGSHLASARCLICHTSEKGKTLNSYGKAVASVLKKEGTKKVTSGVLHAVDSLDSSHTGQSNIARIRADELPGG